MSESRERQCGCTVDAELNAGSVCPSCGHRDHGRSGCSVVVQFYRAAPSSTLTSGVPATGYGGGWDLPGHRPTRVPSPALTREALTEPVLTRVLGEVALVVGGDLRTGGVKHRIALSSAIIERLSALGTPGLDALRQRVIDTARDLNMTMPDLGDGDPMSALDDALADLDEALSKTPPPSSTREETP